MSVLSLSIGFLSVFSEGTFCVNVSLHESSVPWLFCLSCQYLPSDWLAIKTLLRKPVRGKQAKEYLWLFVFVYCFIVLLCVCLVPWPYNIFHTAMARYSLFVLKVPLNTNQLTNHQDITPESWSLLGHTAPAVMSAYPLLDICLRKILSNIYILHIYIYILCTTSCWSMYQVYVNWTDLAQNQVSKCSWSLRLLTVTSHPY